MMRYIYARPGAHSLPGSTRVHTRVTCEVVINPLIAWFRSWVLVKMRCIFYIFIYFYIFALYFHPQQKFMAAHLRAPVTLCCSAIQRTKNQRRLARWLRRKKQHFCSVPVCDSYSKSKCAAGVVKNLWQLFRWQQLQDLTENATGLQCRK